MSRYRVKGKKRRKRTALERLNSLPEKPRRNHRRELLTLILSCIVFGGIYISGWQLQNTRFYRISAGIEILFYLLLAVLAIVFVIVNRGLSGDLPAPEQLSEHMSVQEKADFIDSVRRAHDRARPLLYVIFPLLCIVGFDIFYTLVITK